MYFRLHCWVCHNIVSVILTGHDYSGSQVEKVKWVPHIVRDSAHRCWQLCFSFIEGIYYCLSLLHYRILLRIFMYMYNSLWLLWIIKVAMEVYVLSQVRLTIINSFLKLIWTLLISFMPFHRAPLPYQGL